MEPNDAGGDADRHNDDDYKPLMGCETDGEYGMRRKIVIPPELRFTPTRIRTERGTDFLGNTGASEMSEETERLAAAEAAAEEEAWAAARAEAEAARAATAATAAWEAARAVWWKAWDAYQQAKAKAKAQAQAQEQTERVLIADLIKQSRTASINKEPKQ